MYKYFRKSWILYIRKYRARIVGFISYTIVVLLVLKLISSLKSVQSVQKTSTPNQKQLETLLKEVEATARKHPSLVLSYKNVGPIDQRRSEKHLPKIEDKLSTKPWLMGDCDFKWISHGVLGIADSATIGEYTSEILVSRHVTSVASRKFTQHDVTESDVTLLTQLTDNRFHLVELVAAKWDGPINVAVFVPMENFVDTIFQVCRWLESSQRHDIIIHVVISTGRVYPVNWLRNLVIKNATTDYIFCIDIDFIPSSALRSQILQGIKDVERCSKDHKQAVIIPAFELFSSDVKDLPDSKKELLKKVNQGLVNVFHQYWHPESHRIWRFDKWRSAQKSYMLPREEKCTEPEPYIAIRRSLSPLFPETLLERGKNKVAYYFELCITDFTFTVLGEGHLTHLQHPESIKAGLSVERCVMDSWRVYRHALAHKTNKLELYSHDIPDRVQSLLYFIQALYHEGFWLAIIYLPVIIFIISRIICRINQAYNQFKTGSKHVVELTN